MADGNIDIRFHNGKYTVCGSLFHINGVHDFLSRRDAYPHLELEFPDESLASMSGPPSFLYPNSNHNAMYVHQESIAEETFLEFVTTCTGENAGDGQELRSWKSGNLVSDVSANSEATQRSESTESSNVEVFDKSADMSNTVAGGFDKKEEISDVKTTEKGAGMNDKTASDTDKHDQSCAVDVNDKSADTSDRVVVDVDKQDNRGISTDDGDQRVVAKSCSRGEDNPKAALEGNKEQENEIVSDGRMVDSEVWDYMREIKSDQLHEMLKQFGASYKSEWDPTDGVLRVRLVIKIQSQNQSMNENLQKSITLVFEQFGRLYNESFASCEVEPINAKYMVGNLSANHLRMKFPNVLLKYSPENVLLIGPSSDVKKAKKYIVSNSKKMGRMHKSFCASSSSSCMDLTERGDAKEDRTCQSATFTANDSVSSIEDAESLKDKVEEGLKSKSLTTDKAQAKDEKASNQLVSTEKESAITNNDGCGDGSTATEFEHLDSNDHEKSSSSDSFSILPGSGSFDNAEDDTK